MRRLWQHPWLFLCIGLAVIAGVVLAFGDHLANLVVRRALARAEAAAEARGLDVRDLRFGSASFVGLFGVRCDDFAGTVTTTHALDSEAPGAYSFASEHLLVRWRGPWRGGVDVVLTGGTFSVLGAGGVPTGDALQRINAEVTLPFSWRRPAALVEVIEDEARAIRQLGRTRLPLVASAVAHFEAGHRWHDLPVRTELREGGAILALERDDVARLSREYTLQLTETEITLVAENPARAPMLLRLSERATRVAQAQRRSQRGFPYDAFRHVYWSWLLTRTFGAEFAEQVTQAHEIGATYETGAASRRMDLNNNAIGRVWALAGVTEEELIRRVPTDTAVMRAPGPANP